MTDGPPLLVAGAARRALSTLAAGVLLVLLAVVLFAVSRVVAGGEPHSYDPGARPPASYRFTAGQTYQLSSPVGVAALQAAGKLTSLACYWSADGQLQNPLPVLTTMTDARDLRTFATVTAPSTGRLRVGCDGIDPVFVDDADDSGPDRAATLMLVTILVGFAGVVLAVAGGYRLADQAPGERRDFAEDEDADEDLVAADDLADNQLAD